MKLLRTVFSYSIALSRSYVRGVYAYSYDTPRRVRRRRDDAEDPKEPTKTEEEDDMLTNTAQEAKEPLKRPSRRLLKNMMENAASFDRNAPLTNDDIWSSKPYPSSASGVAAETKRLQYRHALRPSVDPEGTSIILFPGQGAQYPGMGRSLLRYPNVKRIYDMASQILEYDLLDVCLNGEKDELRKTIYCQPAMVVTSLAALERLKDEAPHVVENCVATAGFSVGEITSLIFAGALDFEDGMKLVRIRAEAMQAASELEAGGMMTVFYGPSAKVGFACKAANEWCIRNGMEKPVCVVANYLYPGCKVIAGHDEALNFITKNAKDFHLKRLKRLPVGGAFHSMLMAPAAEIMTEALNKIEMKDPLIPVFSNFDGKPYKNAMRIKKQLCKQICSPVKWEQTLHILYERPQGSKFPNTYEVGPGKALQTILQMVNSKAYDKSHVVEV